MDVSGDCRFWTAVANLLFWTQVADFEFWTQVAGFWILNIGDRYIIMGAILHTTGGFIIMDASGRLWILELAAKLSFWTQVADFEFRTQEAEFWILDGSGKDIIMGLVADFGLRH